MAGRIRSIKPEWLENQRLSSCSSDARVLSIGLIVLADDYGRGRASIGYLAGQVWPESERGRATATKSLDELAGIGYVQLYRVNEQDYYQLPGWERHQVVKNPGKAKIPEPSTEGLRRVYGESTENLPLEGKGTEGEGKGKGTETEPPPEAAEGESAEPRTGLDDSLTGPHVDPMEPHRPPTRLELEAAYQAYPRHAGKAKGLEAAKAKIRDRAAYQALMRACQLMGELWAGHELTYCPHFSTFVNQSRWLDDELPAPKQQVSPPPVRDRAAELWAKADAIEAEERARGGEG